MKSLSRYFRGYLKETILGPLFKLLEALFELLTPIIIAKIIDHVIPTFNKNDLYLLIAALFFMSFIGVVVAILAQYFSSKSAVGYTKELTRELYSKVMGLSQEDRDTLTTSSLVTRLTSDTYQIQTGINQFLRLFLRAPIIVLGSIILSFLISPSITVWFVMMVMLLFVTVFIMSHLLNPIYANIRKAVDAIVNHTRQQLEGVRVIRAFGQVDREEKEFITLNNHYKTLLLKGGYLTSLVNPLTYLVVNVTLVLVIWQGALTIQTGNLSQGMLIALINYLLQILNELLKMTMLVTSLNQSFISANRITQVFEKESENLEKPIKTAYSSDYALVVNDMSFTYPSAAEPSLAHIDFELKSGQFLGIIGGTGAGKSTLVKLLSALYRPQIGTLSIFHNKQTPQHVKQWRSLVRVVPQKADLFQGTIRSNLTLGLDGVVEESRLWRALVIAQASDFVKEKDGQLDAPVEAFGRNFSGGQRQRLTIARAFVQKSPFLILDDSTSALDYLTEAKLLEAIHQELTDTCLILISQRTNSLKKADKILILDKGQQAGFDTHENLLQHNPLYQSIHWSQHKKGASDESTQA